MSATRRILVVGPAWVGDMVMAQSLFMRLKADDPAAEIDVLAPPWSLPLLRRMPEVASGIELDVAHGRLDFGLRRRVAKELRRKSYARAIVLPRSFKAALIAFWAAIPQRTGYLGEWRWILINDRRKFDAARLDQTVKRFAALGGEAHDAAAMLPASPKLSVDQTNLAVLLERHALDTTRPIVALMPGAEYGPAKQWPMPRFVQLAQRLAVAGINVWVLGSSKEVKLGESISQGYSGIRNLCGQTQLVDTVDLLSVANAAVTNDSGLMHVAAAVGTHVIAIYGSSTPAFTPPLTERKDIVYQGLECSPCFARTCPLHHTNCLHSITVDAVEQLCLKIALPGDGALGDANPREEA